MEVVVVTAAPFLMPVRESEPLEVVAGNKGTVSVTFPVPLCGVKLAVTVQARPVAMLVAALWQPLAAPAASWKSAGSVWARPVAGALPALVMVPLRTREIFVPKAMEVALRGISSTPVCVVSAAKIFPERSTARPEGVVSDVKTVVLGPLTGYSKMLLE